jgi:ABC-type tungstate transport system substrate-binding protein
LGNFTEADAIVEINNTLIQFAMTRAGQQIGIILGLLLLLLLLRRGALGQWMDCGNSDLFLLR